MIRYKSRRAPDIALRKRLRDLANERRRFGYRRLFILLRREGEPSGINRIYRVNREEGLKARKRRARRKPDCARLGLGGATADATNRLSVNTPNVLLNNAGATIDVTVNKNAPAALRSWLMPNADSGRPPPLPAEGFWRSGPEKAEWRWEAVRSEFRRPVKSPIKQGLECSCACQFRSPPRFRSSGSA